MRALGSRFVLTAACLLSVAACAAADAAGGPESNEPGAAPSSPPMPEASENQGVDELVRVSAAAPMPVIEDGRYVFRVGEVELAVDPAIGGRITRFSLAGRNILTGPEVVAGGEGVMPDMYGSTFWTSPQSGWGWPPEVAIDNAPHAAVLDGAVLALTSEPGAATGYVVRKRLAADAARGVVDIEYTLENRSATEAAAPWEISRVPKSGFVVFPATGPALPQSTLPGAYADGLAWVDLSLAPPSDSKLFQDGTEGWLAYLLGDIAFIKTFEDLSPADAAPGEAEIEIFTNGLYDYAEIEQQGRYGLPPVGGRVSWGVSWLLARVPAAVDASLGSAALVDWIRSQVARTRG